MTSPALKISVVIPSVNGERFLRRCIPALLATELPAGVELDVLVVLNGSTDGSSDYMHQHPSVQTLRMPEPLGFGAANNLAQQHTQGDVLCFLNNDTEVDRRWLFPIVEVLRDDPNVVGLSPKLVFMHRFFEVTHLGASGSVFIDREVYGCDLDAKIRWPVTQAGPQLRQGRWGFTLRPGEKLFVPVPIPELDVLAPRTPTFKVHTDEPGTTIRLDGSIVRLVPGTQLIQVPTRPSQTVDLIQNAGSYITRELEGGDVGTCEPADAYSSREVVPSLCGAALFVRRQALDRAGWFPPYYRVYYEDTDLCLSLRRDGGTLVYCGDAVVRHYHTGTNREYSPFFVRNVARSSLLFALHFGSPNLVAQTLRGRVGHLRAEFRGYRQQGWSVKQILAEAPGVVGFREALLHLPRLARNRIKEERRAVVKRTNLLDFKRREYKRIG